MAAADKITLVKNDAVFINDVAQFSITSPITLSQNVNWFYLSTNVAKYKSAYLYLNTTSNANIGISFYRSAGYNDEDSDNAVLIPNSAVTITAASPFVVSDYFLDNYGGDRIWIKMDCGALTSGAIASLSVIFRN
jgi:hypothetical protein